HTIFSRDWSSDVCSSDLVSPFRGSFLHGALSQPLALGPTMLGDQTLRARWRLPSGPRERITPGRSRQGSFREADVTPIDTATLSESREFSPWRARHRFAVSALTTTGAVMTLPDFFTWFEERRRAADFAAVRVPLAGLTNWSAEPETGNLTHDSGGFFTIEGLEVHTDFGRVPHWSQPII